MSDTTAVLRNAVQAALDVCRNHPQPVALAEALLVTGFTLREEKEGKSVDVHYDPAFCDSGVEMLAPKALAYLEQQARGQAAVTEDQAGNAKAAAGEEAQTPPPAGISPVEFEEMKWLATSPAPGRLRPVGKESSRGGTVQPLTEEEQEELEPWESRRIKMLAGGPLRSEIR